MFIPARLLRLRAVRSGIRTTLSDLFWLKRLILASAAGKILTQPSYYGLVLCV
jgi:hypothetical protein